MHNRRFFAVAISICATVVFAACGSASPAAPAAAPTEAPAAQPTEKPAPTEASSSTEAPAPTVAPTVAEATDTPEPVASTPEPTVGPTTAPQLEKFDPANFDQNSAVITNPWLPLKPGTHWVYEGSALRDDGALIPHRIEITVSDLTKVIGGVRALATWDLDFSEDVLEEAELAFYAQDKDGTIWRMGEYPEVYDNGKFVEAPSWIHGYAGALAGIMMPSKPEVGSPSYAEGWGPAVDWTDRGQVDQVGQSTCVRVDCYQNVLVIAETSLSEKDAQQLKYYASGVGNVRVGWRGSADKSKESMELTRFEQLTPEEMAVVHAKVLELEKSAYEHSKDVYGQTQPMESLTAMK